MSYNIMGKNASFKGDISGTIENQVNDWDNQSISGSKSFAATITSSADVMLSGSGKVSASFFYGDGSNLDNVGGTITSYTSHATNRLIAGGASSTAIKGLSEVTFASSKLGVTGQISASLGVTGSQVHAVTFHGSGASITDINAGNIGAGSLSAARLNLASAGGLENSSNSLQINLSSSTSGLSLDSNGLQVDVATLASGSFVDTNHIIVQDGTKAPTKIPLSVLESNMTIRADKVTSGGRLGVGTLPTTINGIAFLTSSVISASTFHGNGAALTGVTSTPTPAGSNTQIQFNNNGAIAADAQLTFLTGSNTLATTILSASSHVSASSYGGVAGTLIDSAGNFAGNNASFNQITASHEISSSQDIFGLNFRGNGSTLNNVPMSNYASGRIIFAGSSTNTLDANSSLNWDGNKINTLGLSASADIQAGGHITGSGDLVFAGPTSKIHFDPAGSSATNGPFISTSNLTSLMIDGDSILNMQGDTNIRLRVGGGSSSTHDMRVDITETHFSSSIDLSASALHFADSPSAVITSGGNTFLDNNGNINTGAITMTDGAGALNFGNNQISGSGNISGSAFFGDGSNLTGISTSTYYYLHNPDFSLTNDTTTNYMSLSGFGNKGGGSREPFFIAPASGSVARVLVSTALNAATGSNTAVGEGNTYVFYYNVNTVEGTSGFPTGIVPTAHVTSSAANLQSVNYRYGGSSGAGSLTEEKRFKLIIDLENNNPTVSGSNSFDPGDVLIFGMHANDAGSVANNQQVTVVLKLTEPYTYP